MFTNAIGWVVVSLLVVVSCIVLLTFTAMAIERRYRNRRRADVRVNATESSGELQQDIDDRQAEPSASDSDINDVLRTGLPATVAPIWDQFLSSMPPDALRPNSDSLLPHEPCVAINSVQFWLIDLRDSDFLSLLQSSNQGPSGDIAASLALIFTALNRHQGVSDQARLALLDQVLSATLGLPAVFEADTVQRSLWFGVLGNGFRIRFSFTHLETDADMAIRAFMEAGSSETPQVVLQANWRNNLGLLHLVKASMFGQLEQLDAAIDTFRQAVEICPPADPARVPLQHNLALALRSRFGITHAMDDLDETVDVLNHAILLTSQGSADWSALHYRLAYTLQDRNTLRANAEDLDNMISAFERASTNLPKGKKLWIDVRTNQGNGLLRRFSSRGNLTDADAAVAVFEDIRSTEILGSAAWCEAQVQTGTVLQARFAFTGDLGDLDSMIDAFLLALTQEHVNSSIWPDAKKVIFNDLVKSLARCRRQDNPRCVAIIERGAIRIARAMDQLGDHREVVTWYHLLIEMYLQSNDDSEVDRLSREAAAYFAVAVERDAKSEQALHGRIWQMRDILRLIHTKSRPELLSTYVACILENLDRIDAPDVASAVLIPLGEALNYIGSSGMAQDAFEASVRLARRGTNYELLVSALCSLGVHYNDTLDDAETGLRLNLEAVAIAEAHNCKSDTHAIFCVGNILLNQGKGVDAEPYLRRALALGKQRGEYGDAVHALRALARQYTIRGLLPDAVVLLTEATAIGRREQIQLALVWALGEFGHLLSMLGEYQRAFGAYQEAIERAVANGYDDKVKEYNKSLETIKRALMGEVLIFQMIDGAKWVRDVINVTSSMTSLMELANTTRIQAILWSFSQGDLAAERTETGCEELLAQVDRFDQELNGSAAFDLRIKLNRAMLALIHERRGWYSHDLFSHIQTNNSAIEALARQAQDVSMLATSKYWTLLATMTYRRLILHGFPDETVTPVTELDGLWEALQLLVGTDSSVVDDLLNLVTELPSEQASTMMDRMARHGGMAAWRRRIGRHLAQRLMLPPPQAIAVLEQIMADGAFSSDSDVHLSVLLDLADNEVQLGHVDLADNYFREVLRLAAVGSHHSRQVDAYIGLGKLHRQAGRYDQAIAAYDDAIDLARQYQLANGLAHAYHYKGNVLYDQLDYPGALAAFHAALDQYLQDQDYTSLSLIFNNIANVAEHRGDPQASVVWYRRRALDLAVWGESERSVALGLFQLGQSLVHGGAFEEAKRHFDRALEIYQEIGEWNRAVFVIEAIAHWYANSSNPLASAQEALNMFQKALRLCEQLHMPGHEAANHQSIAVQVYRDDFPAAMEHLDRAIDLYGAVPDNHGLIRALETKARILTKQKKSHEALPLYLKCLDLLDGISGTYASLADYTTFLAEQYSEICESAAVCAYLSGDHELVFRLAERGKGIAFRKQLTRRWTALDAPSDVPTELLERERTLSAKLRELDVSSELVTGSNAMQRTQAYATAQKDLHLVWAEMEDRAPSYAVLRAVTSLTAHSIQAVMHEMGAAWSLVELLISEKLGLGLLIVVDSEEGLTVRPISIISTMLDRALARLAADVSDREEQKKGESMSVSDPAGTDQQSQKPPERWHEGLGVLAEAIAGAVPPGRALVVVPHRQLHHLPLHALPLEGGRLCDRNPVVAYLPTASLLNLPHHATDHTSALVVGAVFEKEARRVARILAGDELIGEAARVEAIRTQMERYGVLHFSCHGFFDPARPLLSGLQVAREQVLTADAVLQTELVASLVVLSACQTAQARILPGDELEGLTQAFLLAGAHSVVSTLWAVDTPATAYFMDHFYHYLREERWDVAAALQYAQRQLREDPRWEDPRFWAAFILTAVAP